MGTAGEFISNVLQWTPTHGHTSFSWPAKLTFTSFMQTMDSIKTTYIGWWLIGADRERESNEFIQLAHSDEEDERLLEDKWSNENWYS